MDVNLVSALEMFFFPFFWALTHLWGMLGQGLGHGPGLDNKKKVNFFNFETLPLVFRFSPFEFHDSINVFSFLFAYIFACLSVKRWQQRLTSWMKVML